MDTKEVVRRLRMDGWCVLQSIVPDLEVADLRNAVTEQEKLQRAEWEAVRTGIQTAGQQLPPAGVGHAQALVNYIPQLAGYLADARIVAAAETIFGPYIRISSVSGLVNFPGNERGYWHADWPFNQMLASCIAAPYPDLAMQLSGILMLTDFSAETGGTLIIPGSHRAPDNPTMSNGVARYARYPTEMQVCGAAGSFLYYDSRLWHAVAPNLSSAPRVAVTVRYGPWWLNLEVRRRGSLDFQRVAARSGGKDNSVPLIPKAVFESLPQHAQSLFMHWIEE
jgi:ectoine hydroxylase-related dioxygenase (phytanoyl-CoA dioxygenase family)